MSIRVLFFFLVLSVSLAAQDDPAAFLVESYSDIDASHQINSLHLDQKGRIISSSNQGVHAILGFESPKAVLGSEASFGSAMDRFGQNWWLDVNLMIQKNAAASGYPIEKKSGQFEPKHVSTFKGKVYVSTSAGLLKVDIDEPNRQSFQTDENSKLPNNSINFSFADPEGVLWIGTQAGICRVSEKNWKTYEKKQSFSAATHTKEGTWLASNQELWLVDKFNRWYPAAVDKKLSRGTVKALASDSEGRVFIASEILVRYDPYKGEIIRLDEDAGFFGTEFSALAVDQEDAVWVGSTNQGLFRVRFGVEAPQGMLAVLSVSQTVSCFGGNNGALQVQVTGGREPYFYQWADSTLNGPFPNRLAAGEYVLTVFDALGDSTVLRTTLSQPEAISLDILEANRISGAGLKDGSAEVKAKGGTGPYSYEWSNGATEAAIKRLPKGMYTVLARDKNACETSTEVEIKKEPAMPALITEVLEVGQTLQINELYFDADSAKLDTESFPALDEIYEFLTEQSDVQIEIGGHTNNIPLDAYCDSLSTARARVVAEYLYAKGIGTDQVTFKGYGKRTPIASNRTEAGRKRNQRVELKVLALKEE